jgi:hypothetical protein
MYITQIVVQMEKILPDCQFQAADEASAKTFIQQFKDIVAHFRGGGPSAPAPSEPPPPAAESGSSEPPVAEPLAEPVSEPITDPEPENTATQVAPTQPAWLPRMYLSFLVGRQSLQHTHDSDRRDHGRSPEADGRRPGGSMRPLCHVQRVRDYVDGQQGIFGLVMSCMYDISVSAASLQYGMDRQPCALCFVSTPQCERFILYGSVP